MYCLTVVHTRSLYPSSHRLVFKANACKVGDSKPSSVFFIFQKESHLSEERVSVLMVYSLKVV